MKVYIDYYLMLIGLLSIVILNSCGKEFLEIKRDKKQVTPESLNDLRALLDDDGFMNYNFPVQLGVIGADEYHVSSGEWTALTSPIDKNGYIWGDDIYEDQTGNDWNRGFEKIMFANFVLDGLKEIPETIENKEMRNEVQGTAHFYRGISYFLLAQLFCDIYRPQEAQGTLGLPLRTTSNINIHYERSTLDKTYQFILDDLIAAVQLLPQATLAHTRPNKAAALTLLAMVYMQMNDYTAALPYAQHALALNNLLIDYNQLDTNSAAPFPIYGVDNPEILFYATAVKTPILSDSRIAIDTDLYESYEDDDLRKKVFYTNRDTRVVPKGGYSGITAFIFTGITTAETYLVAAECLAMTNTDENKAVELLNSLRKNRYNINSFIPIASDVSRDALLELIMAERRKEMPLSGRRWLDLRRYIAEDRDITPPERTIAGEKHILFPNSKRWVWPIPPDVISIGGIVQNER